MLQIISTILSVISVSLVVVSWAIKDNDTYNSLDRPSDTPRLLPDTMILEPQPTGVEADIRKRVRQRTALDPVTSKSSINTWELGVFLIKYNEGLILHPYKCPSNFWTIGWGHRILDHEWGTEITGGKSREFFERHWASCPSSSRMQSMHSTVGDVISVEVATEIFNRDIEKHRHRAELATAGMAPSVRKELIKWGLTSLSYNLGIEGLYGGSKLPNTTRYINQQAFNSLASHIKLINRVRGSDQPSDGLTIRRQMEGYFLRGEIPQAVQDELRRANQKFWRKS